MRPGKDYGTIIGKSWHWRPGKDCGAIIGKAGGIFCIIKMFCKVIYQRLIFQGEKIILVQNKQ